MFLRCSYLFGNLSLDVLINMVLTQKNQCSVWGRRQPMHRMMNAVKFYDQTDGGGGVRNRGARIGAR